MNFGFESTYYQSLKNPIVEKYKEVSYTMAFKSNLTRGSNSLIVTNMQQAKHSYPESDHVTVAYKILKNYINDKHDSVFGILTSKSNETEDSSNHIDTQENNMGFCIISIIISTIFCVTSGCHSNPIKGT